jgi:hypothetical protein
MWPQERIHHHHQHPAAMLIPYTLHRTALLMALLLACLCPRVSVAADGRNAAAVVLTGWLHVDDLRMDEVVVEVEVGGSVEYTRVSRNGRFTVGLPAGTEATLRFERNGYQTKEVLVDTRGAVAGTHTEHAISFAVVLDPVRTMGGQTFAGPVATISVAPGGGGLAVVHTRRLVPARHQRTMEF